MACSTPGSLRMNSAENPPTVDCSVIGTAIPSNVAGIGRLTVPTGSMNLSLSPTGAFSRSATRGL
jgi:hypothetical protein